MSDTILTVQNNSIQTVSEVTDNFITTAVESTVVVASAAQGPAGAQGIQGIQGPQGPQGMQGPTATISTASDVDISTIKTGSLLIYNQNTGMWVSDTTLAAQYVDAGEF